MDVWTVVKIALRRWYVVLPVLVVTGLTILQLASTLAPTYTATGQVLLVTPNVLVVDDEEVGVNPYLSFNASLSVTANVLSRVLDSAETRRAMARDGLLWDYSVLAERDNPVVVFTAEGPEPEQVVTTIDRLMDDFEQRLASIQVEADAPDNTIIQSDRIASPDQAEELSGNRTRVLVAVAGLGFIAAIGAAVLVESVFGRRAAGPVRRRWAGEDDTVDADLLLDEPVSSSRS